jgi:serine/threonine-protein kinase RsbW
MKQWQLTLPSDPDNIVQVEQFLNNIFSETDWSEDDQASVGIAVTEIVNNAIIHGNKAIKTKNVDVLVIDSGDEVEITIKDENEKPVEITISDPTTPENIYKTHGRGLFLVKTMMDKLYFENTPNGTVAHIVYKKQKNQV